ncbi:MAG: hypothetical protein ACYC91_01905 [Solirubrobacteraceae bacterium]
MSAATARIPAPEQEQHAQCAHCGAPLAETQEWCLECGGARTLIHRSPDWRMAAAIVALVLVLALAGFVFVLIRLSAGTGTSGTGAPAAAGNLTGLSAVPGARRSNRLALGGGPSPSAGAAGQSSAGGATASSGSSIAAWPVGLSGWTVVLARDRSEAGAHATAVGFARTGTQAGVLDSSEHPAMTPGYWIVFSGRYPDSARASAAAAGLQSRGYTTAQAERVAPPGGL